MYKSNACGCLLTIGIEGHQLLINGDELGFALAGVVLKTDLCKLCIDFSTFKEVFQFPTGYVERLRSL